MPIKTKRCDFLSLPPNYLDDPRVFKVCQLDSITARDDVESERTTRTAAWCSGNPVGALINEPPLSLAVLKTKQRSQSDSPASKTFMVLANNCQNNSHVLVVVVVLVVLVVVD